LYAECLSTQRTYLVDSYRTSPAPASSAAGAATATVTVGAVSLFRRALARGLDGIQHIICSSIYVKFYASYALSGDWVQSNTTHMEL
jgi:hypothetical protein